jgi:hypothetical protein
VAVWLTTAAGHAKTPGGWPGENGSRRGSAGCGRAKCTRRAAAAHGGGKSRKRRAVGGWPRTLGCAGGAVGSVQGLSRRVDTLSSLAPMRSVKLCREQRMTAAVWGFQGLMKELALALVRVWPEYACRTCCFEGIIERLNFAKKSIHKRGVATADNKKSNSKIWPEKHKAWWRKPQAEICLPFAPTRCGSVDGAGLEWGIIVSDAPKSTKNLKLFFESSRKIKFFAHEKDMAVADCRTE